MTSFRIVTILVLSMCICGVQPQKITPCSVCIEGDWRKDVEQQLKDLHSLLKQQKIDGLSRTYLLFQLI